MSGAVPFLQIVTQRTCAAAADAEPSVETGRRALGRWWSNYPWYDSSTDGIRRVKVSKPWNWDWLDDWFKTSGSSNWRFSWPSDLLQWVSWILLILALAAIAYLLWRAYRRRREGRLGKSVAAAEQDAANDRRRIEALPAPVGRRPSDLLSEARRLYEEGCYSEAIVYLFSHRLVQLDKHQLIHMEKGKTNRQYLRELGARAALRQLLDDTMVAFEDVFFGDYRLDRLRFDACWLRQTDFEALLAEGAR